MHLRLLLGSLLLGVTCVTHAFESWEHKQLGDLSYHVAMNIYCRNQSETAPGADLCERRRNQANNDLTQPYDELLEAISSQRYKEKNYKTTYGDVAKCVDFFLSPDKLIAGRERDLINNRKEKATVSNDDPDPEPAVDEAPKLFPTERRQLDLDQLRRCKDELTNLEGLRSAHVNHTHFQAELLVAQRNNHIIALSMRTMEDNLFSALVMNAVSDHFLQDSFAPGHIAAWRSRLTDLAANAYHDRVNRDGLYATIPRSELATIMSVKDLSGKNADLLKLLYAELSREAPSRRSFFEPLKENTCSRGCRKPGQNDHFYQEELTKLYNTLQTDKNIIIKLRGDNDLWLPSQDEQRLVMLLFEVRSILDILESQPTRSPDSSSSITIVVVDSFKKSGWKWHFTNIEKPATSMPLIQRAKDWLDWKPSVIQARIGAMYYGPEDNSGVPFSPEKETDTLKYTSMDQIFGFSMGADNMIFGDTQTRYVFNFETVVWGRANARRSNGLKTANFAASAGIQPYLSRDYKGIALGGRLIAVFPEVETSVSIPMRMLHLQTNNGHSEWQPTIGLRIDAGFTSFLTFYLQANYDAAPQRDGTIRRGASLGAGFQLAAPQCRIWLLDRGNCTK